MEHGITYLDSHLVHNRAISFHHMKHKANYLDDCLANEVFLNNSPLMEDDMGIISVTYLAHKL